MTIREKFDELIKGLVSQQVITESQSSSFEPIITQFETLVKESETKAIKAAAQVTESRMAEYDAEVKKQLQEAFAQLKRHNIAEIKLAKHSAKQLAEAKMVKAVDAYLNEYVKKVLPNDLVVDYDRLQRLEEMHKQFKTALIINDSVVYNAAKKLKEAVEDEIKQDESDTANKMTELQNQIAELLDQKNALETQIKAESRNKALDEKLKDIPTLEAKKVRKYFEAEDATVEEIESDFDQVLSIVKKALDIASAEGDDTPPADAPAANDIDDKIANIVGATDVAEDDDEESEESDEDEEDTEDIDAEDDDEESEEDANESVSKKSKKKILKENNLMRFYINNYQKLNS